MHACMRLVFIYRRAAAAVNFGFWSSHNNNRRLAAHNWGGPSHRYRYACIELAYIDGIVLNCCGCRWAPPVSMLPSAVVCPIYSETNKSVHSTQTSWRPPHTDIADN